MSNTLVLIGANSQTDRRCDFAPMGHPPWARTATLCSYSAIYGDGTYANRTETCAHLYWAYLPGKCDRSDSVMCTPITVDVGNSLWVINAAEGDVLARIPVGMGPTHPIASLDGTRVYVTNTDEGSVTVIETDTWEVIATIPGLPEPHDGELTPDGAFLYLATSGDSTMTVVDTDTFESLKAFKIGQKPRRLAVGGENGYPVTPINPRWLRLTHSVPIYGSYLLHKWSLD